MTIHLTALAGGGWVLGLVVALVSIQLWRLVRGLF